MSYKPINRSFYSEHIQHRTPCIEGSKKKVFDCIKLTYIFVQNPELVMPFAASINPRHPQHYLFSHAKHTYPSTEF
jgi:hypothetical protein